MALVLFSLPTSSSFEKIFLGDSDKQRFIMIFILLLTMLLTAEAVRRDAKWTMRLIPSDNADQDYEGVLEVIAVFKDGRQHAVTLPSTTFQKSRPTTFNIGMISPGPLQLVYLRTHGVCPLGKLPLNVLRLRQVDFESVDTNTTYTKIFNDLAIKDKCQSKKSLGTAIKDLEEYNSAYCFVEGKKYADGEKFDMGCVARCTCQEGRFGCVDMCPPVAWEPEQQCHFVHVPGQCCDVPRCLENQYLSSCSAPIPDKADQDIDSDKAPVRRYPWSVFVCVDPKCSQVYGGSIVGSRHILLYGPDISTFQNIQLLIGQYIADAKNTSDFSPLRIVNITSHPDFINLDSPIADSASRLQLLQVDQLFTFDKLVQSANLPFNNDQCAQLSQQGCQLQTVGWDRTDDQEPDIRQYFLHSEKSIIDQSACSNANSTARGRHHRAGPKRRGDKRVCVNGLTRQDCTGPIGGAVVVSRGAVDFLVGLLDPDNALFSCEHQGTAAMLPICKYTEWIQSVTTSGNY